MKKSLVPLVVFCSLCLLDACGGSSNGSSAEGRRRSQPTVTHLSVIAPQNATTGAAFNFTVTALDASNNTVTTYSGTVSFSSTDSQAMLPANLGLTDGSGIFSATLKTAGSQTITATDTVAATITGVSNVIGVSSSVPTGTFTPTGSMEFAREGHTATLLSDEKVLIVGGQNATGTLATAEIFDPSSVTFSSTGRMGTARAEHTATLLSDGRVLVTGGSNASGTLASAEIFDPSTGTFASTGNMAVARTGHTATLLKDGRVLVAGGRTAAAELFDSQTGQFTPVGNMTASRTFHTATLLSSGKVLMAGGTDSNGSALGDLFDPATAAFTPTANGGTQALQLAAALLQDGRVFLAGGEVTVLVSGGSTRCCISGPASVALANLFNSSTDGFSAVGDMSASRASHTVTLLNDGEILIAGGATITTTSTGTSPDTTVQPLASAELFNPASGNFESTGSMITARASHTATLLTNGKVLVAGGVDTNGNSLAAAELFQ